MPVRITELDAIVAASKRRPRRSSSGGKGFRSMLRHSVLLFAVIGCIATVGVTGCGSSSSSSNSGAQVSTTHFAKTKFLLHAGLAFGAFHHFILGPVRAGDLKHPFSHKLTLIKAGLASLFVYHELKLAAHDAQSSKILRVLVSPLTLAAGAIHALKSSLTSGGANPQSVSNVNSSLARIGSQASADGQSISDSVPSVSQLG
jgi:hypothetical protein